MSSPSLQTVSVQARIDDRHREASVFRSRSSASSRNRSTQRFIRHYVEMVVVMFTGMFALMAPTGALLSAFGSSWDELSPAMNMFAMALTMTVPMVAWMRFRGHALRANAEMAASMLLPTVAVMGVLSAGLATSGTLMVPEHAGMLTCMLVAMLHRRDEYSCASHAGAHARRATKRSLAV